MEKTIQALCLFAINITITALKPRPNLLAAGQYPRRPLDCWVPVMQRAAGPTRGVHMLPRIGQEVLVGFLHGQMDQPIVLASAYNGRGEGSSLAHEDRAESNPAHAKRCCTTAAL